ncbi:MAG: DUF5658 family protein [Novosphingobium sp.]|nr:DUF5658 family protein [Novosphingobium sp.]
MRYKGGDKFKFINEPPGFILTLLSIFVLYLFANDIVLTDLILSLGGVEYNILMMQVVSSPAIHVIVKSIAFAAIACIAYKAEKSMKYSGGLIMLVTAGFYSVVVLHNIMSLAGGI